VTIFHHTTIKTIQMSHAESKRFEPLHMHSVPNPSLDPGFQDRVDLRVVIDYQPHFEIVVGGRLLPELEHFLEKCLGNPFWIESKDAGTDQREGD
jgi:hypothetical protein